MKGTGLMGGRANTYWAGPLCGPNLGLYPFYMAIYIYKEHDRKTVPHINRTEESQAFELSRSLLTNSLFLLYLGKLFCFVITEINHHNFFPGLNLYQLLFYRLSWILPTDNRRSAEFLWFIGADFEWRDLMVTCYEILRGLIICMLWN